MSVESRILLARAAQVPVRVTETTPTAHGDLLTVVIGKVEDFIWREQFQRVMSQPLRLDPEAEMRQMQEEQMAFSSKR